MMAAPIMIATMPARNAHWSPARNDSLVAAVICLAYWGYCWAVVSAGKRLGQVALHAVRDLTLVRR